jgi:hypothetical protein
MKVSQQGREFVIICNAEEFDMLDNGLSWFISECETGRPNPAIDLAKQMMTDIANMEDCNA